MDSSGEIVGAVTAQFQFLSQCEDDALAATTSSSDAAMYILTLGVAAPHRRQGLGWELLRRCIAFAETRPTCVVVYLHVLWSNETAISFYLRHGFLKLRTVRDYYLIDGRREDCHVLVHYVNGGRPAAQQPLFTKMDCIMWPTMAFLFGSCVFIVMKMTL